LDAVPAVRLDKPPHRINELLYEVYRRTGGVFEVQPRANARVNGDLNRSR